MKRKIRYKSVFFSFIILSVFTIITGCKSHDAGSVSGTGFYFDTVVSFTVYGTEDNSIIEGLMKECSRFEKIFSTTDSESELYRLNHNMTEWVSEDLYRCVEKALFYCELMNGRYDISIRQISELWNFRDETRNIPEGIKLEEALATVGYKKIGLLGSSEEAGDAQGEKPDDHTGKYRIRLEKGTMIDLGSAAKGYIGDRLIEYLKGKGIGSAIISLGGNVQCIGGKPDTNGEFSNYKVAVKSPFGDSQDSEKAAYSDILKIKEGAVVTSGIYERCFEKDGKLYHHILDPSTGYPIENDLASVTIISKSGFAADMLSTVCFIAGYEETLSNLEELSKYGDFEAEFILKDGSVRRTDGYNIYISDKNQ